MFIFVYTKFLCSVIAAAIVYHENIVKYYREVVAGSSAVTRQKITQVGQAARGYNNNFFLSAFSFFSFSRKRTARHLQLFQWEL